MKIKKMRLFDILVRISPDYRVTVREWDNGGACILPITELEEARKQLPQKYLKSDVMQIEILPQRTKTYDITIITNPKAR